MGAMVVKAECHSDDRVYEVDFNAVPWLRAAKSKDIVALARCGWGGDYPADEVTMYMAGKNSSVKDMFKYIELKKKGGADIGFECHALKSAAMGWLMVNRPSVYRTIKKLIKLEGING